MTDSNFPTAIDTPTDPNPTDPMVAPSHSGEHAFANDAIVAIETAIGITGNFNFDPAGAAAAVLAEAGPHRVAVADVNYTCSGVETVVAFTSITAARTVTLPAANSVTPGRALLVRDDSGYCSNPATISLLPNGSDTINHETTYLIQSAWESATLTSDGVSTWLLGGDSVVPMAAMRQKLKGVASPPFGFSSVLNQDVLNNSYAFVRKVLCYGDSTVEGLIDQNRTDSSGVSFTSASNVITDPNCKASDLYKLVSGTNVLQSGGSSYVTSVTPGVSFTISSNPTGSGSSITLQLNYWVNQLRNRWQNFGNNPSANQSLGWRGGWSTDITFSGTWRQCARNDTASWANGSDVITDASIIATDQGKPVAQVPFQSTGIPVPAYVGTVTPGTSFLLSSSPTSQVNLNATANETSAPLSIGTGGLTDLGMYHWGTCADGNVNNIVTWTRPTGTPDAKYIPSEFISTANICLMIALGANINAGATISYQINGTGSWTNLSVANTGAARVGFVNFAMPTSTTSVSFRAADASGTGDAIAGVYGVWLFTGDTLATDLEICNFAKSGNWLFNLNGTGIQDVFCKPGNGSVELVTIGPYTNDIIDSPSDYGTNIANLINHYPGVPVIVVGAYEQQPPQTLTCTVANSSPNVIVTQANAPAFVATRDDGSNGLGVTGASLAVPTHIATVTDATHLVLSNNWTGATGSASLTFNGRSLVSQNADRATAKAAAMANGAAFIDLQECWGSFYEAWNTGLMNDALHESQLGHTDIAARIHRLVRDLS